MNRYQQLIPQMASDMGIKRGDTEPETEYKMRVLYSALGRLAYASLWDTLEDDEHVDVPVSEVHFKRRIQMGLQTYHRIYPELRTLFFPHIDEGVQMIYMLFKDREMYHSPYRLAPAATASAVVGNTVFLRGADPLVQGAVSGLGRYALSETAMMDKLTVGQMYQLSEQSPVNVWEHCYSGAKWEAPLQSETLEFLRTKPPFSHGYWQKKPEQGLMLARTTSAEMKLYYLCQMDSSGLYISQLPDWRTGEGEYLLLAAGLLMKQGTFPPILFHRDGERVLLHVQYLLPPHEQGFLEFYTWPDRYLSDRRSFQRICSAAIFPAIRQVLESIGYSFAEE